MVRYIGAKLRITRRLGDLPGFTCRKSKPNQRPGQHGARQKKLSDYAIRLEKKLSDNILNISSIKLFL